MRDTGLIKARAFRDETEALPEAERALLRVNVNTLAGRRVAQDVLDQQAAHTEPPLGAEHRHTFDLPSVRRMPSARRGHGQRTEPCQEMFGVTVKTIELQLDGHGLLLDENGLPDRPHHVELGRGRTLHAH
jgi:hypothetical protein